MFLLLLVLYRTDWYMTAFCLGLVILLQLYDFLHFVEKTNRDISDFLEAIRHSDFTQRFAVKEGNPTYKHLYESFNEISDSFQKVKTEKQAHYLYLQTIVEHIGIGILSFDEAGEVNLVNQVTKNLLHVPHIKNVHALERVSEELAHTLLTLGDNDKAMITVQAKGEQVLLTLHATVLISQGRSLKIVSLQNIQSELEEQEMQTWQKMIRVLTHEIMNSVTPIVSLTSTVSNLIEQEVKARKSGETLDDEVMEDIQDGLKTIEKRSTGMLHFVKSYRRLMRLPSPEIKAVNVSDLLRQVHTLMLPEMEQHKVKLAMYLPTEQVEIAADPEQMEHVLINLIKNGMEACQHSTEPRVEVMVYADEPVKGKVRIDVSDNGPGIPEDIVDKVFIPFYTTKKQGSGIGLSLSKQIMRQHGGTIRFTTKPGGPTVFSLQL